MEKKIVGNFLNNIEEKNEFTIMAEDEYFVDKTRMIEILNSRVGKKERFMCITRPRRFGKSVNAMMVASYYAKNLDMKDTFDKLDIAKCPLYEKHLNKHNVIYMSFNTGNFKFESYKDYRQYFEEGLIKNLKQICPDIDTNALINDVFKEVYRKTKEGFIFVIDEWDYIFNCEMYTKEERRNFLKFLESLLKDKSYVDLAYMTGILPISKNSSGSSINMFKEYNAINDSVYDKYFGFTQEEVEKLCAKQDAITIDELKEWYDGYCSHDGEEIYNPRSVVCALQDGVCQSYWTNTGKQKEIANYINTNIAGVKEDVFAMLSGEKIEIILEGFEAEAKASYKEKSEKEKTKNLILSAMTVLGFLSYYATKEDIEYTKQFNTNATKFLKIPNKELMMEFNNIITSGDVGGLEEVISDSQEMLLATIGKDTKKMEELIEKAHKTYNSYFEFNTENALACIITILYLGARTKYTIKREDVGATGRADFAFYPNNINGTSFILELKKDDTPENAIEQIKTRDYFIPFKNFKGRKLLVGIAYDTKNKKHSVKVEEL